jgi:AraC family transcriptional regulator of adaptative response/methylated-DNA-[protein]-cysteine methyltransferase
MEEECYWQAVLNKDIKHDGEFVYGVRSTKIYCNPSCSSRRPRREQVVFFSLPVEAERSGFRPCRRCQPGETVTGESHVALVRRICSYIEAHVCEPVTLAILGEQAHMSPFHLQRVFKHMMGITPHQYVEACRLHQLKARLKDGDDVTTALYDAGYSSSSRLYENAPIRLGMTPTTYRRGGYGMHIYYTLVASSLGRLLVAGTEKGICSVCIGDDDKTLEATLLSEYPAASIERDEEVLNEWAHELVRHLAGQQPHLDLPIDVRATAFQWRVWEELRRIPYGETRSYSQIASALGNPNKARAVANACANNPIAIVVPCHRIVREDGNSGGYRWGAERKQQLLEQEQTTAPRSEEPDVSVPYQA